jgi:hypothetical protein
MKPLEEAVLAVLNDGEWHKFSELHGHFPTGMVDGGDSLHGRKRLKSLLRKLVVAGRLQAWDDDVENKVCLCARPENGVPADAQQEPAAVQESSPAVESPAAVTDSSGTPQAEDTTGQEEHGLTEPTTPTAEPADVPQELPTTERDSPRPAPGETEQPGEAAHEIVQLALEDLRLHPALADVPRMRPEEGQPFLEDVREHGVREPLTVQVGQPHVVLDGRHRLEAAKEVDLAIVPVRLVNLSESEQQEHVIVSALHRRNLTDDQRAVLAARCYAGQAQQARQDRARKGGQAGGRGRPKKDDSSQAGAAAEQTGGEPGKGRKTSTRQRVAEEHGVPEKKLRNAIELEQQAPEVAQQVLDGEITLKQALQAVRDEERQATTAAESETVGPDTPLDETGGHEQPALDPCPRPAGTGLQVPAGSPQELAEALVKALGREAAVGFLSAALAAAQALAA